MKNENSKLILQKQNAKYITVILRSITYYVDAPPPPVLVRSSIPPCASMIYLAPLMPGEIALEIGASNPDVFLLAPENDTVLDATRSHFTPLVADRDHYPKLLAEAKGATVHIEHMESKGQLAPAPAPASAPASAPPPPQIYCPPIPRPVFMCPFPAGLAATPYETQRAFHEVRHRASQ